MAKRSNKLNFDLKKLLIKSLINNSYSPIHARAECSLIIARRYSFFGFTAARNCCRISGRQHFILSNYGIGRILFRTVGGSGYLCGVCRTGK